MKTVTFAEALALEDVIYKRLEERRKAARLAESKYWEWLDCDCEDVSESDDNE